MASGSVANELLRAPLSRSAVVRRFLAAQVLAAENESWDAEIAEMRKRVKEAATQLLTSSADALVYDDMLHAIEAAFELGQRSQHDAWERLADLKARHAEAVAL